MRKKTRERLIKLASSKLIIDRCAGCSVHSYKYCNGACSKNCIKFNERVAKFCKESLKSVVLKEQKWRLESAEAVIDCKDVNSHSLDRFMIAMGMDENWNKQCIAKRIYSYLRLLLTKPKIITLH